VQATTCRIEVLGEGVFYASVLRKWRNGQNGHARLEGLKKILRLPRLTAKLAATAHDTPGLEELSSVATSGVSIKTT